MKKLISIKEEINNYDFYYYYMKEVRYCGKKKAISP